MISEWNDSEGLPGMDSLEANHVGRSIQLHFAVTSVGFGTWRPLEVLIIGRGTGRKLSGKKLNQLLLQDPQHAVSTSDAERISVKKCKCIDE